MKILYRISDGGNIKNKPNYVHNKKAMFLHFINTFKEYDIRIFADNISDETYQFIVKHYDSTKIIKIALGNAKSFMYCLDYAITNFADDEKSLQTN
jgi:cellulose synthase/poly-beta-1,6-N-acetylglucosamine synthase-like glycosyltransferase